MTTVSTHPGAGNGTVAPGSPDSGEAVAHPILETIGTAIPNPRNVVKISAAENALLMEAKKATEESQLALARVRERFLREERAILRQLDGRRNEASALLDMIARRYLHDREGDWDYSTEAEGFVRVLKEETK